MGRLLSDQRKAVLQIAVLQEVTILAETQNVVKMNRPHGMNVGVVIFLIIIIYVVFNIFSYLTSSTVAEYEVGQGMIATNHVYQGLIMRDETIVYAGQSGYVNYRANGGKVGRKDGYCKSIDIYKEQYAEEIKLFKRGYSYRNIQRMTGTAVTTLRKVIKITETVRNMAL